MTGVPPPTKVALSDAPEDLVQLRTAAREGREGREEMCEVTLRSRNSEVEGGHLPSEWHVGNREGEGDGEKCIVMMLWKLCAG